MFTALLTPVNSLGQFYDVYIDKQCVSGQVHMVLAER